MNEVPEQLINAATRGKLALFVGAGISANATNRAGQHPPKWPELLLKLAELTTESTQNDIGELVQSMQLLKAAELLRFEINKAAKQRELINRIKLLTNGPTSDPFSPSNWHTLIDDLNPQIIITTNYDKLLEGQSPDTYTIDTYKSTGLDSVIRNGETVILKIHGDISRAHEADNDIVLSISDYAHARREGQLAFQLLRAIFLTHTTLFIGYSMTDPDLQVVLEDLFSGRTLHSPHYLFTQGAKDFEIDYFANCYGIKVLNFDDYGFSLFEEFVTQTAQLTLGSQLTNI